MSSELKSSDAQPESKVNSESEDRVWPETIRMTGLPFHLQGWNCELYRVLSRTTNINGKSYPIYRLDPYMLYCCIGIIGVEIRYTPQGWILVRDYDYGTKPFVFQSDKSRDCSLPYGAWSYGAEVIPSNIGCFARFWNWISGTKNY